MSSRDPKTDPYIHFAHSVCIRARGGRFAIFSAARRPAHIAFGFHALGLRRAA